MEQKMSFGDFIWPCNPDRLAVRYARDYRELSSPFAGSCLQDFGRGKRTAGGEGVFPGEKALQEAADLAELCMQGGSRLLVLPGHTPFYAVLCSLEVVGLPEPECVRCRFVFWEDLLGTGSSFGTESLVMAQ